MTDTAHAPQGNENKGNENKRIALYDVVIVGGGPAGLACAIAFGQRGFSVAVCEKRRGVTDKACGEGLLPGSMEVLERLGILSLLQDDAHILQGVWYHSQSHSVRAGFSRGVGVGVRRTLLIAAMHERLHALENVSLLQGVQATAVTIKPACVRVQLTDVELQARLVVGADGLHSKVRQWAGLQARASTVKRFGMRAHFKARTASPWVEVFHNGEIEAYVTPLGHDLVNVAFLWRDPLAHTLHSHTFDQLLNQFPEVKARITDLTPLTTPRSGGPFLQRTRGLIADGVALVGDAAGYIDAMTGEGVGRGIQEAEYLAQRAADALSLAVAEKRIVRLKELRPYERGVRSAKRTHDWMTRILLALSRSSRAKETSIAFLARYPALLQKLVDLRSLPLP